MVKITKDEQYFFKKYEDSERKEPLFIYGCTPIGKWMGLLLDECGIEFISYIDKNIKAAGKSFFGHNIINKFQLLEYIDSPVYNIILTVEDTKSVLLDFWNMDQSKLYNILLPKQFDNGKPNGNLMLAPLRYRLIKNKKITVIANNCSDINIYRYLGIPSSDCSPFTIGGAALWPTDFLKLVENFEYYMHCELQIDSWEYRGIVPYDLRVYPSGKLGDIRIYFPHAEGEKVDHIIQKWEEYKHNIYKEHTFWILSDAQRTIPYAVVKRFSELPVNKCISLTRSMYYLPSINYTANSNQAFFDMDGMIIEDWFDLIGWINGDYTFG